MLSLVSTWMGDRLGTPGAVVNLFIPYFFVIWPLIAERQRLTSRQRPYHIENTSSRPITEVKQC